MNQHPPTCEGCPLNHKGAGFVSDEVKASKVAILALLPSLDDVKGRQIVGYAGPKQPLYENKEPAPMIGSAGWMLCNTYLPLSGLKREDVSIHHLLKCHVKELPKGREYEEAVRHCTEAHLKFSKETEVIVTLGQEPWDFTQGSGKPLHEWRGFHGEPVRIDDSGKII